MIIPNEIVKEIRDLEDMKRRGDLTDYGEGKLYALRFAVAELLKQKPEEIEHE